MTLATVSETPKVVRSVYDVVLIHQLACIRISYIYIYILLDGKRCSSSSKMSTLEASELANWLARAGLTFRTGVRNSATPKAVPFTELMTFCMIKI